MVLPSFQTMTITSLKRMQRDIQLGSTVLI